MNIDQKTQIDDKPRTEKPRIGIVGGGLVGLMLGCILAKKNAVTVDIFEAKPKPSKTPSNQQSFLAQYDARSIALSSGGINILKKYGLWSNIKTSAASIQKIQVSLQQQWGQTIVDAKEEGIDALGFVLETVGLAKILESQLAQISNLNMHWGAKVSNLTPQQSGYLINVNDQQAVVDLLIIADGEHSSSCNMLGITQTQESYEQSALVANVDLKKSLKQTAIERFIDQGVIALLPLNTNASKFSLRAALVWVTPHEHASRLMAYSEAAFKETLEIALGNRMNFSKVGTKKLYPLTQTHACESIRPNLIVMGNAAHGLHPVAAQGFNLSLRDIDAISDMIDFAEAQNTPIGSYRLLAQYEALRSQDQQRVSGFIKSILNTYAGPSVKIPKHLQSIGLFLFDILPKSKSQLARFAMGSQQPLSYRFKV